MIGRVLVANRGEIAVRVIRACHRLGRLAVVAHSEADADSMAVELADHTVALPGTTPRETYLDVERMVAAAAEADCDAVHPGYGFLAERADFAAAVTAASMAWIGPSAEVIALMGDKLAARRVALDAGVPLVPGLTVAVERSDAVIELGEAAGWPLAIKAVHGGGGRGMRLVSGPDEVADGLAAARRESLSAFGRDDVYVERFLTRPRHVEVQLIADHHDGLVIVGDRDCSIQRRYQKLIEEAPAPRLDDAVRAALHESSRRLARAVSYTNAGTIEFLVDGEDSFFLEMNTRIQVEHPVTELVTGVDLVAEQVLVADGEPLSFGDDDVQPRGAAIEVRLNAEDTTGGRFLPAPGALHRFDVPSGPHVRVDTGFRAGDVLSPHYDNLIAKLAVWGEDREAARRRMLEALAELHVEGVPTTAGAAAAVLAHDDFRDVTHSTRWLEQHAAELLGSGDDDASRDGPTDDPATPPATSSPGPPAEVAVLGRWYRIPRFADENASAADGDRPAASGTGPAQRGRPSSVAARDGDGTVRAPMQGTVTRVEVDVGDTVAADTRVVVLEAMKMENNLVAGVAGVVTVVHVTAGANVAPGTVLVEVGRS